MVELAFSYAQHARLDADAATQLAAELAQKVSVTDSNQLGAHLLRLRYPALQNVPLDRLSTRAGFTDSEGFTDGQEFNAAENNQRDDTSNLRAAGPLGEVREVGTALNVATPGGVVRTGQGPDEMAESIKEVLGSIEGLNVEPLLAMRWDRQPAVVARHADGTRVIVILRTDAYGRVIGARSVPYSDELGILESARLDRRYREPATAPSLPVNPGGALVHQGNMPAKTSVWLKAIEKELPDLDTVELIDGGYFPAAANDHRFADFSVKQTATGEQVTTRISSRYRRSGRLDEALTAYELTVFLHDRQGTSEEEQGWRALHAAALLFASERGDLDDLLLLCKRYNVAPEVAERLLGFLNRHRIYDTRLRDPEAGYAYRRTHVTFEAFMREVASGATRPPATQPRVVGKIVDISGYHRLEAPGSDSRRSAKPQVDQKALQEVIRRIPDLAGSRVLLSKWGSAWTNARRGNRVVDVRTMDASGRVGWVQLRLDNNGAVEEAIQILP